MAETNTQQVQQLSDDQINDAMSQSLNGDDTGAEVETADVDETTEVETTAKDKGVPFDPEKFQQQNRELGNQRREISKLTDTIQELREEIRTMKSKPTERQQEKVEDLRDELEEQLQRMEREGEWSPEQAALIRQLRKSGNSGDKALRELQQRLQAQDQELQTLKWERAFYDQFENLPPGSYQKLSKRAYDQAIEDLGQDADPAQLQGAANGYLIRTARILNQKGKSNGKVVAAKEADEQVVVDKTARNKPAGSTKGADIARKSAAPAQDLSQLSTEQLMELEAERLNDEGSLEPKG